MEWTGARYADKPTVEVTTWVDAPPARVWPLVSDVTAMPALSDELQAVEWLDGAREPAVGARFLGRNQHDCSASGKPPRRSWNASGPRVFAWAVQRSGEPHGDLAVPARAERTAAPSCRQWVQMGPGRSGLSIAIDRMPEKEAEDRVRPHAGVRDEHDRDARRDQATRGGLMRTATTVEARVRRRARRLRRRSREAGSRRVLRRRGVGLGCAVRLGFLRRPHVDGCCSARGSSRSAPAPRSPSRRRRSRCRTCPTAGSCWGSARPARR